MKFSIRTLTNAADDFNPSGSPRSITIPDKILAAFSKLFKSYFDPNKLLSTKASLVDDSTSAVMKIREATYGLTDAALSQYMTRPGKEDVVNTTAYRTATLIQRRILQLCKIVAAENRPPFKVIDFATGSGFEETMDILLAYSFMLDAARDKSLPFTCMRTTLLRLVMNENLTAGMILLGSARSDSWHWPITNKAAIEVAAEEDEDGLTYETERGQFKTLALGYFRLTPRELADNFAWLSGGNREFGVTFCKSYCGFFDHAPFALQYLHSMIRDLRTGQARPPVWQPKVVPKSFDSVKSFLALPARYLPEAKLWFSDPKFLISGMSLSASPTSGGSSRLELLMRNIRRLSESGMTTQSVLSGLQVLSNADCERFLFRQNFSYLLKQALVIGYKGSESNEPDDTTAYARVVDAGLDDLISRTLTQFVYGGKKYRKLRTGSITSANANGIFISFSKK